MGVQTSPRAPRAASYAWVILGIVYAASITAPLNQYKVPPILPVLMQDFQLNLTEAGSLMSIFAVTGFLLALPAGIILQRLGARATGLIALGCLAAGSALGAISINVSLLLESRFIEGVGMGLIGVVAPASIALWFPREKQGGPMGIWATWVPVGSLAMYILAPVLATTGRWQSVWWVCSGLTLCVMLAYGLLMRPPTSSEVPGSDNAAHREAAGMLELRQALANRDIWLLGLEFGCFNLVFVALATFLPTFLNEVRGYSLQTASWIASISTVVVLISAPAAGWLSDRIHSRRLFISLPFLIIAVILILPFRVTGWQIIVLMAVLGLFVGAIPSATFAAAPEVMKKPQWAGLGLAVILLGQNLGTLIGPVLFGELAKSQGWILAGTWLIPACILGFLAGWLVKIY